VNETFRLGLAVIVVTLLIVAVAGLGSLGLLAFVGVALDAGVLNETAVRVIVLPFTLFVLWGVRVFPPALAERARSQGRYLDEASIVRATKIVYVLLAALVLAAFVYVLLQQFSPAEVFKILVLPPVIVGGGFLTLMYADMQGGRSGWTHALVVLAITAGLTWLILQV